MTYPAGCPSRETVFGNARRSAPPDQSDRSARHGESAPRAQASTESARAAVSPSSQVGGSCSAAARRRRSAAAAGKSQTKARRAEKDGAGTGLEKESRSTFNSLSPVLCDLNRQENPARFYRRRIIDIRRPFSVSAFFFDSRLSNSCFPLQRPTRSFARPRLK